MADELSGFESARVLGPEAVARLLARLAHLAVPDGLVVLTREELGRAEEHAYALGWQDSMAYQCAAVGGSGRMDAAPAGSGPPQPAEPRSAGPQPGAERPDPVAELLDLAAELDRTGAAEAAADQGTLLRFPHPIPLVAASETERGRELMAHRQRRGKSRTGVPRPRPLGDLAARRRPGSAGEKQD
ncbi:hypothetical protein [Kitasatospora sp. NPDC002040]|uniref:hypothetical protein n=1 Tax=Kitasatospora sp. NPDC002040 TaxID=3154661 RepID=UPI0033190EA1